VLGTYLDRSWGLRGPVAERAAASATAEVLAWGRRGGAVRGGGSSSGC
jgi:hypothetical protein